MKRLPANNFLLVIKVTAIGGEQPLPAYGCCDLGPINLTKFVLNPFNTKSWFDFNGFSKAVEIQVRFLDNVLDATLWPLEEQRKESAAKRRIGVGFTGLGNALAMLGLKYDSSEGRNMARNIATTMRDKAYLASVELAKEKGKFPLFNAKKYLEEGTFASRLPDDIKALIKKHGIRNSHLISIAPTGCVSPDTLIVTENGLEPISNLGDINGEQWQDIDVSVATDEGYKKSNKFFVNGFKKTITILDSYGSKVTATPNHQLRVIDKNGSYVWRRMDELSTGDVLVKCINTYPEVVKSIISKNIFVSKATTPIKQDIIFNEDIAELIGFLIANGNIKTDRHIRLFHHENYSDKTFSKVIKTLEDSFGLEQYNSNIRVRNDNIHLRELSIYSSALVEWMKVNNCLKDKSYNISIPDFVMKGGRPIIKAFVRGLFEGDGSTSPTSVTYTSVCEKFISDLQVLLQSVGIVSRKDISRKGSTPGAFGERDVHRLSIGNRKDKAIFMRDIGFISDKGKNLSIILSDLFFDIPRTFFNNVPKTLINAFGYVRYKEKTINYLIKQGVTEEVTFSDICSIEQTESLTVDISVPDNVTYIANGFVSHNTVSLAFCDNASNGIEPPFSLAYNRKKRNGDGTTTTYPVIDHGLRVFLSTKSKELADALLNAIVNYQDTFTLPGNEVVRSVKDYLNTTAIQTALELNTDAHLLMLETVQPFIDTSISKTVNIPADYPFEDFKLVYDKAWEYKLKGVSTYRPNNILGSVLSVGTATPKEEPKAVVQADLDPLNVVFNTRPLGDLTAISKKIKYSGPSGDGTLFVSVSFIEAFGYKDGVAISADRPIEIFITVSPEDVPAEWVAAYARNLSLLARSGLCLLAKALQDGSKIQSDKGRVRYGWYEKADGSKVPRFHGSEVACISYAIQEILITQGYLDSTGGVVKNRVVTKAEVLTLPTIEATEDTPKGNQRVTGKLCSECGDHAVIKKDGCSYCTNCGALGACN